MEFAKDELRPTAEEQWSESPELQTEFFGDFESYLCYLTAKEIGHARIVTRQVKDHA